MAAVLNSTLIVPKVLNTQGSGRKTSEVFTLSTQPETVSDAGFATEAADGTMFQVVSDGFSRLLVWAVTEVVSTDLQVMYSIIGKRPFETGQIKTANVAGADGAFTAANLWLPCPIETTPATTGIAASTAPKATGGIICNGADPAVATGAVAVAATVGIATAGTEVTVFPSVIVDCSGTLRVSAYINKITNGDGGVILGQFID